MWKTMLATLVLRLFVLSGFFAIKISSVSALHGFSPQNGNSTKRLKFDHLTELQKLTKFAHQSKNSHQHESQMNYPSMDYSNSILTREIKIKQGRLKGVVRELKNRSLKNVEVYLGIPYAAPPVGNLRFMPPGSPPTWSNLRTFDTFGPVCPQVPPDLSHEPYKTMNAGRFNHLKSLLPFLTNQSEDCLYLNIYAPLQESRVLHKYPVIVYIHGESFEWNSGNPYDGSVLASYGKVIVVTINFRLGILGFLKPGISGPTVSNFGLLDQIAALQWVKENIGEFGGDASSVTLMGHDTGAACINFLMVSPVSMASDGLFHKAILMSGTALSDWGLTINPLQFTIQVAEALNCPLIEENDELSSCLRRKRLSEIMSVRITVPELQTAFGPVIDGSVVPNTPAQVMGIYQDLFTRYDLLYGMTEWESYHLLNAVSLTFGMLERERDQLLRQYMHSKFEVLPDFALATTLNEYLYWRKPLQGNQPAAMEHLNLVLDLLSDARVIAPMIQMGLYHAKKNPKSYMYVFQHKSKFGEFAGSERSISGEEIPYVFGVPLVNEVGSLSHYRFSLSEQLLSEFILTHFTNFAKTGNPNAPKKAVYLTHGPREWQQYDVDWPEFDVKSQSFLSLGIPPHVDHQYRSPMTQFWNEELPNLLENPTSIANKIKYPKPSVKQTYESDDRGFNTWGKLTTESDISQEKQPRISPTSWNYGTIRTSPVEKSHAPRKYFQIDEKEKTVTGQSDHPAETSAKSPPVVNGSGSSMALTIFLIIGTAFLILNIFVFALLYYKKKKLYLEERRSNTNNGTADEQSCSGSQNDSKGCNMRIYDMVSRKKDEDYEAVKIQREESRKGFSSSVDSQTRVREWIQQEIFRKCTPGVSKASKPFRDDNLDEGLRIVKPILKYSSDEDTLRPKHPDKEVQKVSVAVDATPLTRGSSVLKQTPIEITKSLDRGLIGMGTGPESCAVDDERSLRKSRTSVSLQLLSSEPENLIVPPESTVVKIKHFYSQPDTSEKCLKTFISKNEDVNVTCREPEDSSARPEILQEDMLRIIQKRNFPKVLPDLPINLKRLSLPSAAHLQSFYWQRNKVPPPPPPRISTLDRKHKDPVTDGTTTMTSSAVINFKIPEEQKETKGNDSSTPVTNKQCRKNTCQKAAPKTIITPNSTLRTTKYTGPNIIIQPIIGPKSTKSKDTPRVNLCNENSLPKGKVKNNTEDVTDIKMSDLVVIEGSSSTCSAATPARTVSEHPTKSE